MTNCIMRKKVSYGNSLHKLFSLILQEQQQKNPVEDGKDLSARTNRLSRQAQPTGVGLHHKRCFCMIRRAFIIINISYLLEDQNTRQHNRWGRHLSLSPFCLGSNIYISWTIKPQMQWYTKHCHHIVVTYNALFLAWIIFTEYQISHALQEAWILV